ncbi:MAG: hypothetical protein B6D61_07495 [Bacteroidetes bacterium 4484_249]|nr:MAG: hypothetical protein B6D61_07495 [Bacteroidetes bacterium 4484_249]
MNLRDNLQKKYVAFLDVLGFKELVGNHKVDSLETYFNTIKNTLQIIQRDKGNIESILISDSTILISPDTKEDFKTLLRAVQTIQAKLALKDIWLRGAISFGEVYFDKDSNLVVGKGLVNAYLLESEAIYPRVIIDTSIIPRIADNRQAFFDFINPKYENFINEKLKLIHNMHHYTEEDSFFVAYAHRIILDSIETKTIHIIYKKIKKNLYSNPKHYKKYLWTKNYFMEVLYNLDNLWERIPKEKDKRQYIREWWYRFNYL